MKNHSQNWKIKNLQTACSLPKTTIPRFPLKTQANVVVGGKPVLTLELCPVHSTTPLTGGFQVTQDTRGSERVSTKNKTYAMRAPQYLWSTAWISGQGSLFIFHSFIFWGIKLNIYIELEIANLKKYDN